MTLQQLQRLAHYARNEENKLRHAYGRLSSWKSHRTVLWSSVVRGVTMTNVCSKPARWYVGLTYPNRS